MTPEDYQFCEGFDIRSCGVLPESNGREIRMQKMMSLYHLFNLLMLISRLERYVDLDPKGGSPSSA